MMEGYRGYKKISRAYSLSLHKTYNQSSSLIPKKRRSGKKKSMIDCNFLIKYSYVGYTSRKHSQKPSIFYRVKITQGHYEHTFELSKVFYNQASHVSHGYVKLNLDGMNASLVILKETPSVDPKSIRPFMLKCIYHKQPLDTAFIITS